MANVESVSLQRKEPEIARCSRLFFAEHDLIDRKDGSLVASIYSTHQHTDINVHYRDSVGVQTFAVLWDKHGLDNRLFHVVEEAIALDVLAPVQLIHHSEGLLTLLLDPSFRQGTDQFVEFWQCIASNVICDCWDLRLMCETQIRHFTEGRQFRTYAKSILAVETLGIVDLNLDHFLFKEEWHQTMLDMYKDEPRGADPKDDQSAFDFFDDDLPF
ncbi:hypothetical protein [Pseudomonas sp. BBP2017]|uniref:hypothetical protein n=1 Tax=Pseudomonas sp. BBP2017 TaxID=2109731 RepID=UPI000D11FA59|nr:hypothetical protein [Pseudomonas sp. BBP2017]PSS59215.1 hypothetical protein C6382_02335 [Pseudomonas sp. BBP2017]